MLPAAALQGRGIAFEDFVTCVMVHQLHLSAKAHLVLRVCIITQFIYLAQRLTICLGCAETLYGLGHFNLIP